jgi:hypothetical protein
MPNYLKQSTAVDIGMGPFVDDTDGFTPETSLTISQSDVRLKKNSENWDEKNESSNATHEENGWYEVPLDATDTDTIGILIVAINESGAFPVWREFQVVSPVIYDFLMNGTNVYQAKVWMFDDNGGTTDRYVVCFYKNGQPITSNITSPTIEVIEAVDGSNLIASTSLSEIASTGLYKYDEDTDRIVNGAAYIAKIEASIDSEPCNWFQPIGRDS